MKKHGISLNVPNDLNFLPVVQDCIAGVSRMMGFEDKAINKIQIGVEEAVTNVITHAFNPAEEASFEVICQPVPLGLKIIVRDKGLPFDPQRMPEFKPDEMEEGLSDSGLGLYLMKKCLDEVSFHNLGAEGMETHLVKYLKNRSIEDYLDEQELEQARLQHKEPPETHKVAYSIRRMELDEAVEVSRGAYYAYGYTYANENIYYPDRVRELNMHEDIISFVAAAENGEIIGHAALEFNQKDRSTAELGIAFVKPQYRGLGCLNQLCTHLLDFAKEKRLVGIVAQAVSSHPYSQKALRKYGFSECALTLSRAQALEFKDIKPSLGQRESLVIQFLYVHPLEKLPVYPPPQHKAIIEKILGKLGVNFESFDCDCSLNLPEQPAEVKVSADQFSTASISVNVFGKNILHEVQRSLKGLCLDRLETIYLYLPLNNPLIAVTCSDFEKMGFFFAGVIPGSTEGSQLLLQYLNNQKFDYSKLVTASDLGEELLEYVKLRDPNQSL